ncbi:hypothetical protein AHAS_Ahas15G0119100 [Arachis hypogaea]
MESRVLSRAATSLPHLRRLPRRESAANASFVPVVKRGLPCFFGHVWPQPPRWARGVIPPGKRKVGFFDKYPALVTGFFFFMW